MPVHFPQRAGLDIQMRGCHCLGQREVSAIGDADLAARGVERLLRKHLMRELQLRLLIPGALTWNLLLNALWIAALEDILLLLRNRAEHLRRNAEILRQHSFRCAGNPVGQQESRVL